jgi:leucine dehydrogenase
VARDLGARWVAPDRILEAPADVFAPCALGAILDHDNAGRVGAPVVVGAANNQLADDAVAGELHRRGVLWVPDFAANAGGIANISSELEPGGYDPARARRRVRAIGDTIATVLDDAGAARTTPLEAAMTLARARLAAQR